MLKIFEISKAYGDQVIFDKFSLSIGRKEKIGLVGRNGHGKSTIFQMILGNVDLDSGEIIIPKRYRIGHLEQHLHFTKPTVLEEGCLGLPHGEEYNEWKVERILSGLGFSESDFTRSPLEFSGGYQVRLNLAKLLVSTPDMLLLDEPNNYLDIVAIRWLEEFLRSWKGEFILITHDRSFMDRVCTHTVAIHRTKARKVKGDTEKLYTQINQDEEIYEKTRLNEEKLRKQTEIFIARFKARASFASRAQSRVKKLEKMGEMKSLGTIQDLDLYFNSAHFVSQQMMSAEDISFSYAGTKPYLIDKFTLTVGKNDRICIIGKNGKGKSTLLKLLAGKLKPQSGEIKEHPLLSEGYFGQTNTIDLNDRNTVLEEIKSANPQCSDNTVRNIAGGLMFSGARALKTVKVLSGGEKNRVLLGKLLVTPCHLLFLDEPTNHLDMQSCDSLIEAVDDFDGSVVMVTHNEMHLRAVATKLVIFDDDKISTYNGGYDDFLRDIGWCDEEYTTKK